MAKPKQKAKPKKIKPVMAWAMQFPNGDLQMPYRTKKEAERFCGAFGGRQIVRVRITVVPKKRRKA